MKDKLGSELIEVAWIMLHFKRNCARQIEGRLAYSAAVTVLTRHLARQSCRRFKSWTLTGGFRWGERSVCTACVWALVCTQL